MIQYTILTNGKIFRVQVLKGRIGDPTYLNQDGAVAKEPFDFSERKEALTAIRINKDLIKAEAYARGEWTVVETTY